MNKVTLFMSALVCFFVTATPFPLQADSFVMRIEQMHGNKVSDGGSSSGESALSELLKSASSSGVINNYPGLGTGAYSGFFWVNNEKIHGAMQFAPDGDPDIFILVTNGGHVIAYSDFTDNVYTGSYGNGPANIFLNGKNIRGSIATELLATLGTDAAVHYTWPDINMVSMDIYGKWYRFEHPNFSVGQKFN